VLDLLIRFLIFSFERLVNLPKSLDLGSLRVNINISSFSTVISLIEIIS